MPRNPNRLTAKDIQESMGSIAKKEHVKSITFYGAKGEILQSKDKDYAAKWKAENGTNTYFIKVRSDGKLFDPERDRNMHLKSVKGEKFKDRQIDKEGFAAYLKFLSTGIERHLKTAERSLRC